ncbi:DNA topoisomerase 2 [Tanacetum coccineum]
MVLVNGSEARGAWSSFIPNYNPRDIIANLKRLLEGKSMLLSSIYRGLKWRDLRKAASNEYTHHIAEFKDEAASGCGKDIKIYTRLANVLEDFYRLRLDLYEKRKTYVLHELKIASLKLKSIERFAHEVWNGGLVLSKKLKSEKCVELREKGFQSLPSIEWEAKEEPQKKDDENYREAKYKEEAEKRKENYPEAEKKARAKRAGDAAGQSTNKKRRMW